MASLLTSQVTELSSAGGTKKRNSKRNIRVFIHETFLLYIYYVITNRLACYKSPLQNLWRLGKRVFRNECTYECKLYMLIYLSSILTSLWYVSFPSLPNVHTCTWQTSDATPSHPTSEYVLYFIIFFYLSAAVQ